MSNEYAIYDMKDHEQFVVQEEEIEEQPRKTNAEIIRELIDAFMPEKVEWNGLIINYQNTFKAFDLFKWELKGLKDKVFIDEEWTQIEKTHYSLSNYGRVRNDNNGKIKSPRFHRWIVQVDIYDNGRRYTIDIKRLVAHYYIRPLEKTEKVRTIDGDIRNNYYKNLEIVSK